MANELANNMVQIGVVGGVKIFSYGKTDEVQREYNFTAEHTSIILESLARIYNSPLGKSLIDTISSQGRSLEVLHDELATTEGGSLKDDVDLPLPVFPKTATCPPNSASICALTG